MWNRYAPAAVAMGQLTWPLALAHLDQMSKWQKKNSFVVMVLQSLFVYNELLRKAIASRTEWNDKSLDLSVVFWGKRQTNPGRDKWCSNEPKLLRVPKFVGGRGSPGRVERPRVEPPCLSSRASPYWCSVGYCWRIVLEAVL